MRTFSEHAARHKNYDADWRVRGADDLPHLLQMWVAEDPEWRIVEIVPNTYGRRDPIDQHEWRLLLRLHHISIEKDDHVEYGFDSWEPEDVQAVVLDALQTWYLMHGVFNEQPYEAGGIPLEKRTPDYRTDC